MKSRIGRDVALAFLIASVTGLAASGRVVATLGCDPSRSRAKADSGFDSAGFVVLKTMATLKCDVVENATEGCCFLVGSIFTRLQTVLKSELEPIRIPCGFSADDALISTCNTMEQIGVWGVETVLFVTLCDGFDPVLLDFAYKDVIVA